MIGASRWLATLSDPLRHVIAEHPDLADESQLVAVSQSAALVHWPIIERHAGDVAIILRRAGREESSEWHDHLALLKHVLMQSGTSIRCLALNPQAAQLLAQEMDREVAALPELPRRYWGDRTLTLSRADGSLQIRHQGTDAHPSQPFSLARLRRGAVLETDDADADLADIARFANGAVQRAPGQPETRPVIIVVVPNGFGLGHVTRMLAVAKRLTEQSGARILFWCFSRAAGIISRFGFEVMLRQTAQHIGADAELWRKWETAEFAAALDALNPDLVVQDAAQLDDFVTDALARPEVGAARLALIRRGMWQKHILGTNPLSSEDLADMVLEPGDLAAEADRGITRGRAARTNAFARMEISAPVILTQPDEMLDRKRARRALGLGRGRHCLISLGGDAYGDWTHLVRHLVDAAESARVRLVWARSPLAAPDPDIDGNAQIKSRRFYPLAPYLAAFDGVVSSAGYNSFHELMQLYRGPVLLAARQHSALDDQAARAAFAASRGWALNAGDTTPDPEAVSTFIADIRAGAEVTTRPGWRDGAAEMSDRLLGLIRAG